MHVLHVKPSNAVTVRAYHCAEPHLGLLPACCHRQPTTAATSPCCLLRLPQAAAVEVGTSLVNTVSGGSKDSKSGGGDQSSKQGPLPEPLKMVGGIGMELLRVSGCASTAAKEWGDGDGIFLA